MKVLKHVQIDAVLSAKINRTAKKYGITEAGVMRMALNCFFENNLIKTITGKPQVKRRIKKVIVSDDQDTNQCQCGRKIDEGIKICEECEHLKKVCETENCKNKCHMDKDDNNKTVLYSICKSCITEQKRFTHDKSIWEIKRID